MEEWKSRLKDICLWKKDIDVVMFVDENNTDTLKHINKKYKISKKFFKDKIIAYINKNRKIKKIP